MAHADRGIPIYPLTVSEKPRGFESRSRCMSESQTFWLLHRCARRAVTRVSSPDSAASAPLRLSLAAPPSLPFFLHIKAHPPHMPPLPSTVRVRLRELDCVRLPIQRPVLYAAWRGGSHVGRCRAVRRASTQPCWTMLRSAACFNPLDHAEGGGALPASQPPSVARKPALRVR